MTAESSDTRLVRRVQKGDKGAFDLLVLKFQHKIVNLVMRYVRDPDLALDITQEAFLKAYRALPRFRGDSAFYTWLYRIGVNTARDWLAHRRRRPAVSLDALPPGSVDPGDDADGPADTARREELRLGVRRALEQLPEPFRTTLSLRELEGRTYEEVAEILGISLGTVESRIFRARCKLRAILEEDPR